MNLLGVNAFFLLIFPTVFKQARVTPLLNKHTLNTSVIENYRPVSLLPFIAKTLERVFFNHVSLFLSQNNKLDAKQSGFRSGHSTETALISVTKALRIAKADSKSSVLRICLPLLTLSIIRSFCPPLITGHHWDSISLVWILSNWSVIQCGLGRGGIQSTSTGHCGSSGISSWTPPLLHIHYITGSHHTGTWLLLPFLCWWHTALSLFSTRWSNGSCTDLRVPGITFSLTWQILSFLSSLPL